MIQRIQTIYLLIASVVSGVLVFLFNFWHIKNQEIGILELLKSDSLSNITIAILFFASAVLSFYTIFLFRKRKLQIKLSNILLLNNILLLSLLIFLLLTLSGEAAVSKKDIGLFLPLISILFIYLAKRAIKKDEALVKSADRIR